MGFIPIPLGVVIIKVLTRCVSIDGRLASIILLFFTFTCLVTLKIVNLVYILGRACKLIDLHKTVCENINMHYSPFKSIILNNIILFLVFNKKSLH